MLSNEKGADESASKQHAINAQALKNEKALTKKKKRKKKRFHSDAKLNIRRRRSEF